MIIDLRGGFVMNKKCEAVYADEIKWEKAKDKIWEKILWKDKKSGSYIRLTQSEPGAKGLDKLKHEFDEFVYVLQGQQRNISNGKKWHQGMYSIFPSDTEHGPFSTEEGIICIEFRYYSEK
jgi:hypothetical protein